MRALIRPAGLVGAFYGILLLSLLASHAWDPLFFLTLGPEWARHDPAGAKRADGIIFYTLALDPVGAVTRVGHYRAARILYPVAAWALAGGQPALVPWTLLLVNWAAIVLGTEIVSRLLTGQGVSSWIAVAYGGWAGLGLPLLHGTAEPLTYLCGLLGIYGLHRGRTALGGGACLAALLGRETALLLVAPYLLAAGRGRRGMRRLLPAVVVLGLWGAWVLGLALWVGGPSFLSARGMGPLLGFRATRLLDLPFSLIGLVLPALAVTAMGARALLQTPGDPGLWASVLNALLVLCMPPANAHLVWDSARLAVGLVAASLLAAPLRVEAPWVFRGLVGVYAGSAVWTVAVAVRYLMWNVVPWL